MEKGEVVENSDDSGLWQAAHVKWLWGNAEANIILGSPWKKWSE